MLCRYYLQIGSDVVTTSSVNCHDVSELVANGAQLEQSWQRKDFGGVVRKYGSRIEFVGDAADLLVDLWNTNYLGSVASFALFTSNNVWQFSEAWQCPLDFSTFVYDGNKVTISCIDNSAASLIKANGGTKNSYQVSQLKSSSPLLYDRVMTQNHVDYMLTGDTISGEETWQQVIVESEQGVISRYWTLPFTIANEQGVVDHESVALASQTGRFWLNDSEGDDFFVQTYRQATLKYDFRNFRIERKYGATDVGYSMTLMLLAWPSTYESLGDASDEGDVTTIVTETLTSTDGRKFAPTLHGECTVNTDMKVTLMIRRGQPGQTIYFNDDEEFWVNTNYAFLDWEARGDSVNMDVIEPSVLLNSILQSVADGKMSISGSIRQTMNGETNLRLDGLKLLAAESARGFDDAYIHTSFNDFAKFMEAVFGYVYVVTDDGTISNNQHVASVEFLHRSDLFTGAVEKTLENVNGFERSVDAARLYSEVNIGYEKKDYENDNRGRDEWNFENYYMTGVTLKESSLELKSPYRADCYGIEEAVAKQSEKESTDKDEDVFLVKCESALEDGHWKIDRNVTITGTFTNTVFNAVLAPIYMVEANKGYIASFCNGLKLSMTRGFRDVVIGGQSVIKNFTFTASDRIFRVNNIKVSTSDQVLPYDLSGLVEFEWNGVAYTGYIESVTLRYQSEDVVEYELIEENYEL